MTILARKTAVVGNGIKQFSWFPFCRSMFFSARYWRLNFAQRDARILEVLVKLDESLIDGSGMVTDFLLPFDGSLRWPSIGPSIHVLIRRFVFVGPLMFRLG